MTFDSEFTRDETGHYEILSNKLGHTTKALKGDGAAISKGKHSGGLSVKGKDESLFGGGKKLAGSFTFDFYLNPAVVDNGQQILYWRTSMNVDRNSGYQKIEAAISGNRIVWEFSNIFYGYTDSKGKNTVRLEGYSTLIPEKWARHTLSFNQETGMIEYLVDGKTEAIQFLTITKHEGSAVCAPVFGEDASLSICPDFSGKIDNFRITRSPYEKTYDGSLYATGNEQYRLGGGSFVSEPILISNAASLDELDALMNVPAQTEIRLYVRAGDDCYGWTENFPIWHEVLPGEKISGVSGQYFQVKADLLPDGAGMKSPSITRLTIKYTEQNEPLPPLAVHAEPGNGSVTVSWSYSIDDTAGGYYVYYGNRPGEYLGRTAIQGPSPIRAGNTSSLTITGLENGVIYYFAVSSYSRIDGRINGTLSKEVYARPSARLN